MSILNILLKLSIFAEASKKEPPIGLYCNQPCTVDNGDGAPWSRRTISSTILSLTSTMDYSISPKHIFHLYTSHDVCSRSLSSDCRSLLSLQTATAVYNYMSILSYVSLIRPVLNVVLQLNMYANYIIIYITVLQYCCKILYPR